MRERTTDWHEIPQWALPLVSNRTTVPLIIFFVAVLLRLVYVWEDTASPFFAFGGVDSPAYLRRAINLINGSWPGPFAFEQPPLYPIWIAAMSKLYGDQAIVLKSAQALLGATSCVLVYWIAQKTFRDFSVAFLASTICAFNGTFIYFDGQIVSAGLEVFLQCAALWFLLRAEEDDRVAWLVGAGLAIGLSAINRGAILVCIPFVLYWVYQRRSWRGAVVVLLPILICILPITTHNFKNDASRSVPTHAMKIIEHAEARSSFERLIGREFVWLTSRTGMNFLLGNTPDARDYNDPNHPQCLIHTNEVMKLPFRSSGVTTASGQQQFLVQQALSTIADAPGEWLGLMGQKLIEFTNGAEIPRNSNLYADRQYSQVLSALVWRGVIAFPAGLIIPLALMGIYFDRAQWRKRSLLFSFLLPRAAFVVSFFMASRLRLPVMPIAILFASFAVVHMARELSAGRGPNLARPAGALALLLVGTNAPTVPITETHGAYEYLTLANELRDRGAADAALMQYRKAVEVDPASPSANFMLGISLSHSKDYAEANRYLSEAARVSPGFAEPVIRLANNLRSEGLLEEAREQFERALQTDPNNAQIRKILEDLSD